MGENSTAPDPMKVQVSINDSCAIEWALDRRMRLVEVRATSAGHVAVMEKFEDAHDPGGFPLIPDGHINGHRVHLRCMRAEDASIVFESDLDSEARRWALTRAKTFEEVEDSTRRGYVSWRLTNQSALTIISAEGQQPMGLLNVRKLVPPGVVDLGYLVHERFRGRGVATAALQAFTEWAARVQLFHRFELGIKPGNIGSVKVAQRAGFAFEGRREARLADVDGGYADELHYARVIRPKREARPIVGHYGNHCSLTTGVMPMAIGERR